jgi:CRP/FNR family cyclic AMP-dependent transcriptional regulator
MPISLVRPRHARLGAEAATALSAYGARTSWPSSFQIYQKGAPADGVSVVLRGHVVLRNRVKSGRGFVPAIITPGEIFGVEGICPDAVYVTDAVASEETETLFVSGVRFRAFVRENPGHALSVIGQMMSERASLLEQLHAMASQNVEQRLVAALKRLSADRSFIGNDGNLRLELKHHRLLCEMVGATRESIALALSRLVGAGMAERKGMEFIVAPADLSRHITADGADVESVLPTAQESMTT